jgi:hypothetical protein
VSNWVRRSPAFPVADATGPRWHLVTGYPTSAADAVTVCHRLIPPPFDLVATVPERSLCHHCLKSLGSAAAAPA